MSTMPLHLLALGVLLAACAAALDNRSELFWPLWVVGMTMALTLNVADRRRRNRQ